MKHIYLSLSTSKPGKAYCSMKKSSKSWLIIKVEPSRFLWGVRPWIKIDSRTTTWAGHTITIPSWREIPFKRKRPCNYVVRSLILQRWSDGVPKIASLYGHLLIIGGNYRVFQLYSCPFLFRSSVGPKTLYVVLLLGRYLLMCIPIIKWPSRCVLLFSQTT